MCWLCAVIGPEDSAAHSLFKWLMIRHKESDNAFMRHISFKTLRVVSQLMQTSIWWALQCLTSTLILLPYPFSSSLSAGKTMDLDSAP